MKKDKLEQFITTNRKSFDQSMPDAAIWAKIDQQLPKQETKIFSIRRILSVAASVCLLVGMGIAIGLYMAAPNQVNSLADISPEYEQIETFYANKVNYKIAQLAKFNKNSNPLLQKDLKELDLWLQQLHTELSEVPKSNRENVINAIIKNYKTKLQVLETVLDAVPDEAPETEESIQESLTI